MASSSGVPHPGITSRACRSGCGCRWRRWRWSRTRCTCWRRGRGGACAWESGCTWRRSSSSRTIRSASRRHGARASALANVCKSSRSSCCRSICISCSCAFPLVGMNYTTIRSDASHATCKIDIAQTTFSVRSHHRAVAGDELGPADVLGVMRDVAQQRGRCRGNLGHTRKGSGLNICRKTPSAAFSRTFANKPSLLLERCDDALGLTFL